MTLCASTNSKIGAAEFPIYFFLTGRMLSTLLRYLTIIHLRFQKVLFCDQEIETVIIFEHFLPKEEFTFPNE